MGMKRSFESANIGPGEDAWRKYFVYGCSGVLADALGALVVNKVTSGSGALLVMLACLHEYSDISYKNPFGSI
jgi:hypothetical protein